MVVVHSYGELRSLVHEEKRVLIYGAGKIATEMIKVLPADGKYGIEGILVTDLSGNKEELFGIQVQGINENGFDKNVQVIIAVGGNKHQEEIREILIAHSYHKIAVISIEFERQLNKNMAVVKPTVKYKKDMEELKKCIKRIMPRTRLKVLVVNICDHCNLNCRGCDHFSPIAEKKFVSIEEIKRDLTRVREILGEDIEIISVMGGEPLLHPNLINILEMARKIFPLTAIYLSTNGILLLNQSEVFWKFCERNNIEINVTKYPINFEYDRVEDVAKKYGVKYMYYNNGKAEKTMGHYPLDISGGKDSTDSFMHCFHANNECNMLSNGRLYTCTVAPNIPIFNQKYGVNIPLTMDDGIDIYTVSGKQELFERLSRPMPICRYCDVHRRTIGNEWEQSKGEMAEWI